MSGTDEAFGTFDFRLDADAERHARALHETSIVVDVLCQGPCGYRSFTPAMEREIEAYLAGPHDLNAAWSFVVELPIRHALRDGDGALLEACWRAAGVTAGTRELEGSEVADTLSSLAIAAAQFDRFPWFERAMCADDVRAAHRRGAIAGFVNIQDIAPFGRDLDLLERVRDLGLAMMQITYNAANFAGSGCTERHDAGLTRFGERLVERANALGIIVDTSHCGPRTTLDACAASRRPVVASHTSAAGLYAHDRAKSDDELKAIADSGGVIGIYAVPFFLSPEPEASIEAMLDHIEYVVELVGWQHVAIGSDAPLQMPKAALRAVAQPWSQAFGFRPEHRIDQTRNLVGFDDYRDFPNITRGLVARGHSDEAIRAILGENFLRVFDAVVA